MLPRCAYSERSRDQSMLIIPPRTLCFHRSNSGRGGAEHSFMSRNQRPGRPRHREENTHSLRFLRCWRFQRTHRRKWPHTIADILPQPHARAPWWPRHGRTKMRNPNASLSLVGLASVFLDESASPIAERLVHSQGAEIRPLDVRLPRKKAPQVPIGI